MGGDSGATGLQHTSDRAPSISAAPMAAGHVAVTGLPASGFLTGTHVWAATDPAIHGNSSAPLNFPQFRLKNVLSTDSSTSGSPQAEQQAQQVPRVAEDLVGVERRRKHTAAALVPLQRPKKRGRPSRKDKAEAAAAAAAAAADAAAATALSPGLHGEAGSLGLPDQAFRKLPQVLPKFAWASMDCATESAAMMLRLHKSKQHPTGPTLNPTMSLGASASACAGSSFHSGEASFLVPGGSLSLSHPGGVPPSPAAGGPHGGVTSASRARTYQTHSAAEHPDLRMEVDNHAASHAPVTSSTREATAQEEGAAQGLKRSWRRPEDRQTDRLDAEMGAPPSHAPHGVPALDWLMDRLQSHGARAPFLPSYQEHADESQHPKSKRQTLGLPNVGSSCSLHQLSSSGPILSRASKPPASVMAAASMLLARECGMGPRLERLPSMASSLGGLGNVGTLQVMAVDDSARPRFEVVEAAAKEHVKELREKDSCVGLDLDLHL